MSRARSLLLIVLISVVLASAASADPVAPATTVPAPLEPPAGATPDGMVVRGTVASLPVIITTPGTYTLDRDYLNLAAPVAIDVRCPDVVIDGAGHTLDGIDGPNTFGIRAHGTALLTGVTVRNLRVTDWAQGIYFWNARGRIEGVSASSNTGSGILLYTGGDGTVITGCTSESNGAGGISVSYSPAVEITSCTVRNNVDDGIYVFESNGARISATTSSGNSLSGVALLGSSSARITGVAVTGCRVASNGKAGIYLFYANGNTVANNRFENGRNVLFEGSEVGANTWNGAKTAGTNIVGGPYLGGNWWSGFSESAADTDHDGIADRAYTVAAGNSDLLPLASPPASDVTIRPGMVITVPGTYVLAADIEDTVDPVIVEVRCSNVVIDGRGHRIAGGGQSQFCGVYLGSPSGAVTGVVIRDLTIANCYYGLYLANADACRVERGSIVDTPSNGMGLILSQGSDGNTVTGSHVFSAPFATGTMGIVVVSSSQNSVYNNEFRNPTDAYFAGTLGQNAWNSARTAGTNIVGGAVLGGNYWGGPGGTGWSDLIADADHDGIGDIPYALATGNTDTYPLVRDRPRAGFSAAPVEGPGPLAVQFTDTSTGSPTSWSWSFGDGAGSTQRNPSHTYAAPGTYTVSLTVGNAAGQSDTETRTNLVTVRALWVSSVDPSSGMQGSTVAVTNLAGTEFTAGATVRLTRAGSADIPGTDVAVVSPTRITCRLPISSMAATGGWNVVVTNRDGRSATLSNGFTVTPIRPTPTPIVYAGQKIVIDRAGSYALSNDIANCNLPVCVEIRASDVIFDGLGHLIDGLDASQSTGISVHGSSAVSNVTIRNVRMQDWWYGVYLDGARNSRIESSTLASNAFTGVIAYQGASGTTVSGCTITENNYGVIFSDGAAGGVVSESRIARNAVGIYDYLSDGISIAGNRIEENSNNGIWMRTSGGGTIHNNLLSNSVNVVFVGEPFKENAWSVTPRPEWAPANIVGGPQVGGNFWASPDGTGFSETTPDADGDGFTDLPLQIAEQNFDFYPLAAYVETPTVPGGAGAPGDTDADGRYEDVNGNGRPDFSDLVLYFNQMAWIAANEPVSMFDYNGNRRIDFADVVWLFNSL